VTITVTCYSWAPSSGDHLLTCGAIFWRPHRGVVWWEQRFHTFALVTLLEDLDFSFQFLRVAPASA